jgi:hypothetical protein
MSDNGLAGSAQRLVRGLSNTARCSYNNVVKRASIINVTAAAYVYWSDYRGVRPGLDYGDWLINLECPAIPWDSPNPT